MPTRNKPARSETFGARFGKTDLDRVGFFEDPSPAPFDVYRKPVRLRDGIEKGRQMLTDTSGHFFEKKFPRIFEGEALTEPWRTDAHERLQRDKMKLGPRMMLPSPSKKHSTPGDWYGYFDKPAYLSPQKKALPMKAKDEREPANMKIKPNPLGGPGYADICLNPFPRHFPEPYERIKERKPVITSVGRFLTAGRALDYFPPNPYETKKPGPTYVRPVETAPKIIGTGRFYVPFPKKPGGKHDGCFNKFPAYTSAPYAKIKEKMEAKPRFFSGGPNIKSKYTNSIIDQITRRSCNSTNYWKYKEKAYPPVQ